MGDAALLGTIITAAGLLIGGLIKVAADRAQQRSTAQSEWQTRLEARATKQEADIEALRDRLQRLESQNAGLADALRDRDELVADLVPIALWIRDGGTPPAPTLTWRIKNHLRDMPPITAPTPIQPPDSPGASS